MIWVLYYLLTYLMVLGIRISSLWNRKSALWINGRRDWYTKLKTLPSKKTDRIWFHVSSLGEFEQARPVIEKLKVKKPDLEIILSFFSPSGFTIRHDYPLASVFYLPADLPGNAERWIDVLQPDLAVFVKYDIWPGYLRALQKKNISTILISAHWKPGGLFHSWSAPLVKSLLKKFNRIFLQNGDHLDYFKREGFNNLSVAGDTRIDRSLELPVEAGSKIPQWLREMQPFDLVAGSTWPADEKIITVAIEKLGLKVILVPHDVSKGNIDRLINTLPFPVMRLTEMGHPDKKHDIILVDTIGLLSSLYALGKIAYVGGGFGGGIHNTLEPMAHQMPLIFGPKYQKFPEAVEMVKTGGARVVSNATELISAVKDLGQESQRERIGKICYDYLQKNAGASDIVTNYLLESIPSGLGR
jgi:3-deoxy-D-manno-octulosonic-acid transferase